jgi:hypothetical protein
MFDNVVKLFVYSLWGMQGNSGTPPGKQTSRRAPPGGTHTSSCRRIIGPIPHCEPKVRPHDERRPGGVVVHPRNENENEDGSLRIRLTNVLETDPP